MPGHPHWGGRFRDIDARESANPPPHVIGAISGAKGICSHLLGKCHTPEREWREGKKEKAEGRKEKARRGDSSSLYDCTMHTKSSIIVGTLINSFQEELVALMLCQNNGSALNYKMFKI